MPQRHGAGKGSAAACRAAESGAQTTRVAASPEPLCLHPTAAVHLPRAWERDLRMSLLFSIIRRSQSVLTNHNEKDYVLMVLKTRHKIGLFCPRIQILERNLR